MHNDTLVVIPAIIHIVHWNVITNSYFKMSEFHNLFIEVGSGDEIYIKESV